MRLAKLAAIFLVLFFSTAVAGYAQTATGSINGTVTDKSGAAISGASVKLTNQDTKITEQVQTNANGHFVFINVQLGSYVLSVEKQGFKVAHVSVFEIQVNQTLTQNIRMDVGAVNETVVVNAETPLLQTSTAELGTVIGSTQVRELPLNGRNFTQLMILTPGITPVATAQGSTSVGSQDAGITGIPGSQFYKPSVNGQANRESTFLLDGIMNTDLRGAIYGVLPIVDTIEEFKVQSQNDKAEFGGVLGGVVNVATKSGTNNIHGAAWEFARSNVFDARDPFHDFCTPITCGVGSSSTTPAPPLPYSQNEFGGAVGGPIFKNKAFFYAGYEGWRFRQSVGSFHNVPTAAELTGDFSNSLQGTTSKTGVFTPDQLFNPYSPGGSTAFQCDGAGNPLAPNLTPGPTFGTQPAGTACNMIPSALINPQVVAVIKAYASQPNFTPLPGTLNDNFLDTRNHENHANSWQIRLDQHFSDRDTVFLRLTQMWVTDIAPIGGTVSQDPSTYHAFNFGGAWDHAFRPNLILDIRAGALFKPYTFYQNAGLPSVGFKPETDAGFTGLEATQGFFMSGVDGLTLGSQAANHRGNPDANVDGSITWIKGNHNIKAGVQYIYTNRYQQNQFQQAAFDSKPTSSSFSSKAGTGNSLASALLGLPSSLTLQIPDLSLVYFKMSSWAGYVEDEWHIRHNLSLTLGLRYDYVAQPEVLNDRPLNVLDLFHQKYNIAESAVAACGSTFVNPCIPGGFPNANFTITAGGVTYNTANNINFTGGSLGTPAITDNIGPRLGVAWQFLPNTVLRAGIGLYYDTLTARSQYAQNTLEGVTWPWTVGVSGLPFNQSNSAGGSGGLTSVSALIGAFPQPTVANTPWNTIGFNNDPNYTDARSVQWHVGVERQLSSNMMLSVAYVGSKNTRLDYSGKANAASIPSPAVTDPIQTTAFGVTTCGPKPNPVTAAWTNCQIAYVGAIDQFRPLPFATPGFTYSTSDGYAYYNALQASLQRRFSHGLQALLSYTWSKCLTTSSGYFNVENGTNGGAVVENFVNKNLSYGPCAYDIPQYATFAVDYELPFGRGKSHLTHGPLSWVLGNWEANTVFLARSGQNFELNVPGDPANIAGGLKTPGDLGSVTNYSRPNMVSDPHSGTCPNGAQVGSVTCWFNPTAFAIPDGSFGNFGVGVLRDQAFYNVDFSMVKNIPFGESRNIQLRAEAFNVFNLQILGTPGATIGSGSPGVINSTANTPRELQFAAKFSF
ncbi:MAG TPA: carboxypeptidase regulatory-like domain-containing protein [Candidatus Acidoferrum sp.]|nr:carboxypeptidase regulatory-like domain-containing protein [Candidatus Acidoferrum sp.]